MRRKAGSTIVEATLIMVLLCLILFGAVQVSLLFAGREVLDYAASMGARSRAVGFNDFMVHKVVRVASIPNAGRMTNPQVPSSSASAAVWGSQRPGSLITYALRAQPVSPQIDVERSRIPLYLGTTYWSELDPVLNYEGWDDIRHNLIPFGADLVDARVRQDYPLRFPMHRAFYAEDEVPMSGEARLGAHYNLYLE